MRSRTGTSSLSSAVTVPIRAIAAGGLLLLAVVVLAATLVLATRVTDASTAGGRWGSDAGPGTEGGRWGTAGGRWDAGAPRA